MILSIDLTIYGVWEEAIIIYHTLEKKFTILWAIWTHQIVFIYYYNKIVFKGYKAELIIIKILFKGYKANPTMAMEKAH